MVGAIVNALAPRPVACRHLIPLPPFVVTHISASVVVMMICGMVVMMVLGEGYRRCDGSGECRYRKQL